MHSMISRRALLGACLLAQALTCAHALAAEDAPVAPQHASPNLARFISETLAANPAMQASSAAQNAAKARAQAAGRPLYNPALELDGENAASDTRTVGLSLTLDMSGKRAARSSAAQYDFAAAESEHALTRQTLASQLLAELARHQAAHRIETLAQRQVELMERFARLTEKSRAAGDVGVVEVDLAHLALAEARMRHTEARSERLSSEEVLRGMGGMPSGDWPELPERLPGITETSGDDALARLPELQAQRAKVNAAQARVRVAQTERKPDPTLGVRGGSEDDDALTGVTLSVPLFVRNSYRAEVEAASQEALREELSEQDIQRRARVRLDGALQRYRGTAQTWNDWQASGSASLANRADQLERLWQAGELSATDYLVQVRQGIDAEIQSLRLWSTAWGAWFDWLAASGGIDNWLGIESAPTARDGE